MSEYISIEVDFADDPDVIRLLTNIPLPSDTDEHYTERAQGEEGSPLAQFLFGIEGVVALTIEGGTLTVTRQPDVEWHVLIDELSNALKEFFL
ncbi:MAG TPA: NifU N-terminal domain-containing protein [Aggregatilineales bacterium]|nr:NifU N-terminal domain-containing protein [Anaerolineales bacterium]HRE46225.1 NifU N-terminal domain-containing protein [Aggregatilineales bacterium]